MMMEVGKKVAVIGTDGIGKSTLIKTLVGKLAPDSGSIKWSENAKIGYSRGSCRRFRYRPDRI